jgi:hypothetical protein
LEPAEAGVSAVDLDALERTMRVVAESSPLPFVYHDPADGQRHAIGPQELASRSGYLPAIVNAGEAIWREATGRGFELDIVHDPAALLGYRLSAIKAGSFSTVMLSSMEAIQQAARPEAVVVSELNAVWAAATERLRRAPATAELALLERRGPRP